MVDTRLGSLVAAAAGDGTLVVQWVLPGPAFEAGLFRSRLRESVLEDGPIAEGLSGDRLVLKGLPNDVDQFLRMGIRPKVPKGTTAWQPTGSILRVRPAPPIFVDAAASAKGADGKTPGTAFPTLQPALTEALIHGGGNIWVRNGVYSGGPLGVPPQTHVYGGFGKGFVLAERDAAKSATILVAPKSLAILSVPGGAPATVLDGLVLDGGQSTLTGLDVNQSPVELRSLRVHGFKRRGLRLSNSSRLAQFSIQIVRCTFENNGAEGVFAVGSFDLRLEGSDFAFNTQEGLQCSPLTAIGGQTSSIRIDDCGFFGNGAEGADIALAPPVPPPPTPGFFQIEIRGSRFFENGADGLVVDEDYETVPGWAADILVRECFARANVLAGLHIDADGPGSVLVQRVRSSANVGDGILVTSEVVAGSVLVSASVLTGNLGAGIHALAGNQAILASHCIFSGNFGGGLVSEVVESAATSAVARLQPVPWSRTRVTSSVEVNDPATFELVPDLFAKVTAISAGAVVLQSGSVTAGQSIELADDGTKRIASQVSGTTVVLDSLPKNFSVPGLLTAFPRSSVVAENYHLRDGSAAKGKGMAPKGAPPRDAGVWGSPSAGAPGFANDLPEDLFRLTGTDPPFPLGITAQQTLKLRFSAKLDIASVTQARIRAVTASGRELAVGLMPMGNELLLTPPPAGWGTEIFRLELHAGLRSQRGTLFSTPLALPMRPR